MTIIHKQIYSKSLLITDALFYIIVKMSIISWCAKHDVRADINLMCQTGC
jgi:hypothetical protein